MVAVGDSTEGAGSLAAGRVGNVVNSYLVQSRLGRDTIELDGEKIVTLLRSVST